MAKNFKRYFNQHYWIRKFSVSSIFQNFFLLSKENKRKVVFKSIYKSNHWRDYFKPSENQSVSGLGSDLIGCERFISELLNFIKNEKIRTILDLACGDFNVMKHVVIESSGVESYLGIDIVDEIIKKNIKNYSNKVINFKNQDILSVNNYDKYDLIIIRDLLIHINNNDIFEIMNKIKFSKSRFFAANNFINVIKNLDLSYFGQHRDINLHLHPFNLDKTYKVLNDKDRHMNIYKVEDL